MKVKLTDVCEIQYGFAFDSSYFTEDNKYIPLVRIRDVKRGFSETFYSGRYTKEYVLHKGALLIGMDGEFNIARWKGRDALLNQRVCKLTAKKGINEEYLRFLMSKCLKQIEQKTAFVTVKHLSVKELNSFEVDMPLFDQQSTIANTLLKVENIIELRKREIKHLDNLIKARFIELFGDPVSNPKGWDKLELSECLTSIDNGKSFVCAANPRTGNEPAVLKLSAATYGCYKPEENKAMIDANQFVENAEVHSGDLLFTRKNTPELVGMCAYVYDTPAKLMMPDLVFRLNVSEHCDKIFLWKLINHDLFRSCIENIATGSAKSMSNISKERLLRLKIILPPIELQQQFATFVAEVDKSKLEVQKALDKTQLLFDSLMQQYFG